MTPKASLPSGSITATVSNIGDLAGQMMTRPFTWTFTAACPVGRNRGLATPVVYAIDGTTLTA